MYSCWGKEGGDLIIWNGEPNPGPLIDLVWGGGGDYFSVVHSPLLNYVAIFFPTITLSNSFNCLC